MGRNYSFQMFSKETWFDDKLIPIAKRELAEAYELTDDQLDALAHDLLKTSSAQQDHHRHHLQQMRMNGAPSVATGNGYPAVAPQALPMKPTQGGHNHHIAPGARFVPPPNMVPNLYQKPQRPNEETNANLNEAGFIRTY